MKTIQLLTVLLLTATTYAQRPRYTPKQQIDRERKVQVQAQTPAAAPVAAYTVNTPEAVNQKTDTLREGVPPPNLATPASGTEPQNSAGLGGAGKSGTATNTIGAPVNPTNTSPARSSNDQTLPPLRTPVVRDNRNGGR